MLCPPTDNQITGCSQLPFNKQHQGDSSGASAERRHLREDERQERGAGNLLIPPMPHAAFFKIACRTDTCEVAASLPGTQTEPSYRAK